VSWQAAHGVHFYWRRRKQEMLKKLLPMAVLALGVMGGVVVSPLRADEMNKMTVITVNEPISVSGAVLSPGQYVLKTLDRQSDIVLVYDRNEQHLVTSTMAVPTSRVDAPDKTEFTFYENSPEQPEALHTWFYGGDTTGLEFRDIVK
jgi:hypothetical protein